MTTPETEQVARGQDVVNAEVEVQQPPTHHESLVWVYEDDRYPGSAYALTVWTGTDPRVNDPRTTSDDNREHVRAALVRIRVPLNDLRYAR